MELEMFPYGPTGDQGPDLIRNRSLEGQKSSSTKQYRLFLSAGITACVVSPFFNPLDCLRVRWQALPTSNNLSSKGIINFTGHIIRNEGLINGLWRPGVFANIIAMGSSAALRFGFYENIRDSLQVLIPATELDSGNDKRGSHMFLAGFTCGAAAYFVTSPLHIIKTMIQAAQNNALCNFDTSTLGPRAGRLGYQNGIMAGLLLIIKEQGILGLWNGSVPVALRGAGFTAGQMMGYDGCKTICKSSGLINDGIPLHVLSSIVAALGATILSTPADYIMTRSVSRPSCSLSQCIVAIYKENGIFGFWRGSLLCFVRVCPVMLTYSTLYEQLRYFFGLGYFT